MRRSEGRKGEESEVPTATASTTYTFHRPMMTSFPQRLNRPIVVFFFRSSLSLSLGGLCVCLGPAGGTIAIPNQTLALSLSLKSLSPGLSVGGFSFILTLPFTFYLPRYYYTTTTQ